MVQKSANEAEIKSKDGKYHICLPVYGVVNLRANAVFSIFALHLTLVCTFFAPNLL